MVDRLSAEDVSRLNATPSHLLSVEERDGEHGAPEWRWTCSCRARGHWTGQSDSVPRWAHARHVLKALGKQRISTTEETP